MTQSDISVVVLNWSDPTAASRCLERAVDAFAGFTIQLILVENGSHTQATLPPAADSVSFLRITLPRNLGVAAGRNRGIAHASGRYVVVLDDDAFAQTSFRPLVHFMDQHRRMGVVGPCLKGANGSVKSSYRLFPTIGDKIARRLPSKVSRRLLEKSEFRPGFDVHPMCIDYVIGACQVLRLDALKATGGFDENFFYGPEDVDLCLRMWQEGWQVAYFPGTVVVHDERRLTRRPNRLAWRHGLALFRYFRKHRYLLGRRRLYRSLGTTPSSVKI